MRSLQRPSRLRYSGLDQFRVLLTTIYVFPPLLTFHGCALLAWAMATSTEHSNAKPVTRPCSVRSTRSSCKSHASLVAGLEAGPDPSTSPRIECMSSQEARALNSSAVGLATAVANAQLRDAILSLNNHVTAEECVKRLHPSPRIQGMAERSFCRPA